MRIVVSENITATITEYGTYIYSRNEEFLTRLSCPSRVGVSLRVHGTHPFSAAR